jgi:hypothetical protein
MVAALNGISLRGRIERDRLLGLHRSFPPALPPYREGIPDSFRGNASLGRNLFDKRDSLAPRHAFVVGGIVDRKGVRRCGGIAALSNPGIPFRVEPPSGRPMHWRWLLLTFLQPGQIYFQIAPVGEGRAVELPNDRLQGHESILIRKLASDLRDPRRRGDSLARERAIPVSKGFHAQTMRFLSKGRKRVNQKCSLKWMHRLWDWLRGPLCPVCQEQRATVYDGRHHHLDTRVCWQCWYETYDDE